MVEYLGVAKSEVVTDDEIGAVQAIVMAVRAGRAKLAVLRRASGRSDTSARLGC